MVQCSFCGKSQHQVDILISGPGAYICNECVMVCQEMVQSYSQVSPAGPSHNGSHPAFDPGSPAWPPFGGMDLDRLAGVLRALQAQILDLSDQMGAAAERAEDDAARLEPA